MLKSEYRYLSGFGNEFTTEALPGAVPKNQNSPQKAPLGLYAEQVTGVSFLAPRHENRRSWLYRIRPSVCHSARFEKVEATQICTTPFSHPIDTPEQLRWEPLPEPTGEIDFVDGLITYAGNGSASHQAGCGIHLYSINSPMKDRCFYDADGDLLIVPQQGELLIKTEFGVLELKPSEIAVIQRGIKFQVQLVSTSKWARGYICENFGAAFRLPDLGPIGSNGLARPKDFLTPTAFFEDQGTPYEVIVKFQGNLWRTQIQQSPFDVVGWTGNYAPYKYDLKLFNTINTVSFDHPDPSIFTVLTSPTSTPGVSNVDFVIFPPRWMVAENTFRPPYFHRNFMSEFMGLVEGVYDAKEGGGFLPGGGSLHNCMTGHGPDANTFEKASETKLQPDYLKDTLAFMFESRYPFSVAQTSQKFLEKDYFQCWGNLKKNFKSH